MAASGTLELGTVLVTGGTGTFGRAFVRRVLDEGLVERIIIYSRDEYKQQDMRAEFGNDARLRFYLGDVRDVEQLERALQGVDTVIHSASLKQIQRSALDILEFVATNVFGTANVVKACHRAGVEKMCFLSTDKAVEAMVPYGVTKALAEWLAIAGNVYGDARICAVRYGNVVGSRGSVLETWRRQHEAGEPLSITDFRMTRFWLSIGEAVDLVLYALRNTGGGEVFIPKITECGLVTDFALRYFPGATFVETGKRSYEKVHEVLVAREEVDRLVDAGYCYVLLPLHVRWQPGPFGAPLPRVNEDFEYRSDK